MNEDIARDHHLSDHEQNKAYAKDLKPYALTLEFRAKDIDNIIDPKLQKYKEPTKASIEACAQFLTIKIALLEKD